MLDRGSRVSPPGSWHSLSAGGYALYNVTLDAVFVSAFAMVAGVIFRVAVAGALVTIFTIGAAIYLPKEDVGPKMLSMLLMDASTLFIPLSIGVLRVRLFDIVVNINRILVDGSLTAILALVYLGA